MGPTPDLPTQFDPHAVEGPLYKKWVAAGYFTPSTQPREGAERFVIVLPPPNVTGSLHIGHALNHSMQDVLVRRRRMQGYDTLWLPGMDHAGIATQNVVELELAKAGVSRHDLGREEFVDRVWRWKADSGGEILGQMRRLGLSVDWSRERFTLDAGLSRAVHTMFHRMYQDGLIYRAERIIHWCPRCLTALSDIEVDHEEVEGELISIRYGDGDDSIVVVTTRAETMLGDTAVAVHPDDPRYQHLIGRSVVLPLTGRTVPIVADEAVDPEFGTGAVKVTPAHDPIDFEIAARHGLPPLVVLDERGIITAPGPFQGLDRFEARPAVVRALREQGRIVAEQRPHLHTVGHCSRCGTVVEPRLSLQWFVKVATLAKMAGDAVREGKTRFIPEEMSRRYFDWVDNMHDWCISRQLWWGHRIPVWYGPDGEEKSVAPDEPLPGEGWTQDPDVLDTWFSSGLWPFSTLGWPDDTADLRRFYPTTVLVTGYDIIFFWVARMMMFALYETKSVPFRDVFITGLVRDQHGKKMSKSVGNVVDPLEWMDRYGTDATRFTLLRNANPGTDVATSEEWAAGARSFCNKLWNASRFALINGADTADLPPKEDLSLPDRWILSRLHATLAEADRRYEDYEVARAIESLFHFTWDEFCDWYLEMAKGPLQRGGAEADRTRAVLGHVLDRLLRFLHPVIPYITEELWITLTGGESVMVAEWPHADPALADSAAEAEMAHVQRLVTEVRRFRSEQAIKPSHRLQARFQGLEAVAEQEPEIRSLLRLDQPGPDYSPSARVTVDGVVVEFDLSGAVDFEAERRRLEKDRTGVQRELDQVRAKLANPDFLARAPAAVVGQMQTREAKALAEIERLDSQLASLLS
ncbi:MAG TPA: valine--tRNA ligase [Acidimicrobiia bacterium]|nr:valine--tRNA ligase [Acidimicrobiia bacterium]